MRYLIIVLILLFPTLSFAAPSISSFTFNNTTSISFAGTSFGNRATATAKYWNKFDTETTGAIPSDQITNITNYGTVETNTYRGTKSLQFDYCVNAAGVTPSCSNGATQELWRRNAIDLGVAGFDTVYVSAWVYLSKSTSTTTTWQWKGIADILSVGPSGDDGHYGLYYDTLAPYNVNETSVHTYSWWNETLQKWYNSAAAAYYYDGARVTNPTPLPNRPTDAYVWGQWQRLEFYAKRASGSGVDDGIFTEQRIGKAAATFNITNAITHIDGNDPWRYVALSHAVASVYNGYVDFKVYMDDVYVDVTPSRVEMCDSDTWAARTHCEIQPSTAWGDTGITATYNPGSFVNGQTVYFYVVDSTGTASPNSDGYVISGGSSDVTAPTSSSDKSAGRYQTSQTITLTCSDNVSCAGTSYCRGAGCTPGTAYSAPFKVLQNIATETLRYRSTDGTNTEEIKELIFRKQRRR